MRQNIALLQPKAWREGNSSASNDTLLLRFGAAVTLPNQLALLKYR
jgi:hypothetical protein